MNTITIDLNKEVSDIMTENLISVNPNTSMLKIEEIFETETFHHIPVLDNERRPVGIISRNDYHQLQHHFTHLKISDAEVQNNRFFKSLIAKDIMNKDLITSSPKTTLRDALIMFSENKFHSIIVVDNEECVGIVTPHDFIEVLAGIVN